MPVSKFQIHGYFYIHNRMPSALFDTIEDVEDSAQYLMNQSTHGITFYRATKLTESKLKITYLQHWSKNHVIQP